MNRLSIFGILLIILLLGFYKIFHELHLISNRFDFSTKYLEKLQDYITSMGHDYDAYSWLILKSVKMQSQLGLLGICDYRPPYKNYVIKNYQIIANMLPELKNSFEDAILSTSNHAKHFANPMQEALMRYIGTLEERHTIYSST